MCNKRTSVKLVINQWVRSAKCCLNWAIPKTLRLDKCMRNLIDVLYSNGLHTLACCCGHGKYPMTIIYDDQGIFKELISGEIITHGKPFYKRDKEGYFYVPELIEKSKSKKRKHK